MKKDLDKKNEIAIKVEHISKTFRIPHEKITSLRGAVVSVYKKKGYEEFKALDDVSFEVKKGEFFGVIGRNGSGKSTLLKILAGIYQADRGKVKVHGMISPFLELGIGFNPELSGRDNIYLNATVLGMTKKQIDKKFDDIVKFSELERFIDQKLKNYSSGMQVRLAFSVSIHANRDILLMDEVLAVGDSNFQSKCLREFNKYREMGRTVIIVTHDISVVERYCSRAMLLRNGKIVKIGKADKITTEYMMENMSDEERRTIQENKERMELEEKKRREIKETEKDEKKINKKVEIIEVKILNKEGKEKSIFRTGEDLSVWIGFKVNQKIKKINFGIGLHSVYGGQIFGYNTLMDEFDMNNTNRFIKLYLNRVPVLSGEYFVNVVCFGDFEQDYYDVKPRVKNISFFSKRKESRYKGFVNIKHQWII